MDELIARIASNVGIERPVAGRAVGIILDFLRTEGPADKVQSLLARLPGAAEAADAEHAEGSFGGIMGVGTRLMSAGLDMSSIRSVTHELVAYAREKGGSEDIDGVISAIPGLSQFV